ncbi:A-kinase anchor protein 12b isoform X2 [Echeneis naucrates]|uniref:A-kinase anchor protein 12b isoform X2 n=1 Tax=Echeneis naucrates TaxID=173247 RepID=UPI001114445D|nr:A-kinase anchor protein 12-like isoform X2 [Echeneis naucrates]
MLGTITLTVGQPDGVSVAQKEDAPETMGTVQDEAAPEVNGEVEKESPDANDISAIEEKAAEEKPNDASEVGFKKIFRFVGFKFTLKKDKSEEKDPVKLLTVKDKDGEEVSGTEEPAKEEDAAEEKSSAEEKEAEVEAPTVEAEVTHDTDKTETTDAPTKDTTEATDEAVKEEGAEKEEASPPAQETTVSPFRKLFSGGLFSNLRKKASIKKPKEEEDKEAAVEEETAKAEESGAAGDEKEEKAEAEQDVKNDTPATPEEAKSEPKEEAPATEEAKSEETPEPEDSVEAPAPIPAPTDETKQEEEKAEGGAEEEKVPAEVAAEAELLSQQEKAKPQGSPLKKLFTGAGLKKLSTKKQKTKKETESKLTESGEQAAELQSSTESTEAPKADSGPSSPEESGEHVIAVDVSQNGSGQETESEVTSDGEKKKEGIIAWSSFKKLVTPKKLVKRSSESEDEATAEKPAKPSENAALTDKSVEEAAEEEKPTEEEPKTENTEKLLSSTEEPKRKMDTSVSWEALMCMGGPKKRTRKTSDSDDEETKIEETVAASDGETDGKTEPATGTSQNVESEGEVVSSPEPLSTTPERESTWDTLKRMVMSKNKAKVEEKPEESADQVQSDGETPKDESSFSLRKFFPGRRKKKAEKQASTEAGSGEEDSDTPAVVPMSEYDEQVEAEQEAPAEPAVVQAKVSSEDRAPSWIPATVEDVVDKHDQLSDIPEEADAVATPKSVDTDITEDDSEGQTILPSKAPGSPGQMLLTAENVPVSPAPVAETTPLLQAPKSGIAQEVVQAIEAQISEVPIQTFVTAEDVPVEVSSETSEHEPPTETAESKENIILEPHTPDEATAICTGLVTTEIAEVALEKSEKPVVESAAVVCDALNREVATEEKPPSTDEATVGEDLLHIASVQDVKAIDLEPAAEKLDEAVALQACSEGLEPEVEKVGVVSTVLEEAESIRALPLSENSLKTVVNPVTPTFETSVCSQSVEVTEPTIETKEEQVETEQLAATEENASLKEVIQVTGEAISSTICETATTTITEETEPAIPVAMPNEVVPVIAETVVIVAPLSQESDQVSEEPDQIQGAKEVGDVVEIIEATAVETVLICSDTQQASDKVEEIKDVHEASEIEAQSKVIAQAVIQDAVDKVSEDKPEPEKPANPTASTPTPVQAITTTEKEIEITADAPVITETPVPIICEKPAPKPPQTLHVAMEVTNIIPIEITESIAACEEEEKKPKEELKQAVEVKVSEESVVVEEVIEIKSVSQTEVKTEQSKEQESAQEPDAEVEAEEEKPQSEETKPEAQPEEVKQKVPEIHTPVQVVLQTAEVVEESVEEETAAEFDSDAKSPASASQVSEEAAVTASAEISGPSQAETEKASSAKCAEVMAQVIEVIEEAVKEIEPVSTEITAAS